MGKDSTKKRRHSETLQDPANPLPASDSIDGQELDIPEELVRDEEDREHLLKMTELEREMEVAERKEKQRREEERLKLIGDQPTEKLSSPSTEELEKDQQTEEQLSEASIPQPSENEEESVSSRDTEVSDSDDKEAVENEAEFSDYLSAQIFRSDLERWLNEPHFEESVSGCFVRFHGEEAAKIDRNRCEYLMVEVVDCQIQDDITPYQFGSGKPTKMQLSLRRGGTQFWSGLNVISNSAFTIKEFEDWVQACKRHNRPLPSKMDLEERKEQIDQARKFVFTHDEVKKILEEKRKQGALKESNVLRRAHLRRLRDFFFEQEDYEKVEEYDSQIKKLEAKAEAMRKSRSSGFVDKQATAREKQLKAETREALIEKRRPRVLEKFQKKLQKLPHGRQSLALLRFYGPSHPLCINIQESDVKKPSFEESPLPDFQPPLPEGIMNKADLGRDFSNPSFYDCIRVNGEKMDEQEGERLLSEMVVEKAAKEHNKDFGKKFLEGWNSRIEGWNEELQSKIISGEAKIIHYSK